MSMASTHSCMQNKVYPIPSTASSAMHIDTIQKQLLDKDDNDDASTQTFATTINRGLSSLKSTHSLALIPSTQPSPPLPTEIWSRILLIASHSLHRFAELTSLSKLLRLTIWSSPTYKATLLATRYGSSTRHLIRPRFLAKLPDREQILLRLLPFNILPTLTNPSPQHPTHPIDRQHPLGEAFTLLHLAASEKMHRLAWTLLSQHGSQMDPNASSTKYRNPTPWDILMVGMLLAFGARPDLRNDRNETPLTRSAGAGRLEIVRMLARGRWPTREALTRVSLKENGDLDLDAMKAVVENVELHEDWMDVISCTASDQTRRNVFLLSPPIDDDDDDIEDQDLTAALFAACNTRHPSIIRYLVHCAPNANFVQRRWFRWRPLHQLVHSFRPGSAVKCSEGPQKRFWECAKVLVLELGRIRTWRGWMERRWRWRGDGRGWRRLWSF
ncbi:hypothetical protein BC829DRAFT_384508 [Chytridium lagenaria]|nr:hypothetical protein BC829DRAFT_384508 [Chytridium lagenaria]